MHLPRVPQEAPHEFPLDREGHASKVLSELQGTRYAYS